MSYLDIARAQLRIDEGVRDKPYRDSVGKLTIGVGRNLDDVGLSPYEINVLLEEDMTKAEKVAKVLFPSWPSLSEARKAALLNMAFNMGNKLAGFSRFRDAVAAQAWEQAAAEMLDSKWAQQVGERAKRLAEQMRTG